MHFDLPTTATRHAAPYPATASPYPVTAARYPATAGPVHLVLHAAVAAAEQRGPGLCASHFDILLHRAQGLRPLLGLLLSWLWSILPLLGLLGKHNTSPCRTGLHVSPGLQKENNSETRECHFRQIRRQDPTSCIERCTSQSSQRSVVQLVCLSGGGIQKRSLWGAAAQPLAPTQAYASAGIG